MTRSPRTAVPENFPDSTDHIPLLLARHEPPEPAAAAHLARLCLDLQLDALLLTLGAGATSEPGREALPWRRWLTEDLALAVELARTALAGGEDLPGRLGGSGEGDRVVDDLSAHYLAMHTMLLDLAGSTFGAALPGSRLGQALEHCRRRLRELDAAAGPRPGPLVVAGTRNGRVREVAAPNGAASNGGMTNGAVANGAGAKAGVANGAPCPARRAEPPAATTGTPAPRTIDLRAPAAERTQYLAGQHLG